MVDIYNEKITLHIQTHYNTARVHNIRTASNKEHFTAVRALQKKNKQTKKNVGSHWPLSLYKIYITKKKYHLCNRPGITYSPTVYRNFAYQCTPIVGRVLDVTAAPVHPTIGRLNNVQILRKPLFTLTIIRNGRNDQCAIS